KAEDVWGNPCERFEGEVKLGVTGTPLAGFPNELTFRWGDLAVAPLSGLRSAKAGAETRIAAAFDGHRAESNVIRALSPGEPKTWWGDLHGQTRATVGTGTIEEYFAFGRAVALLDMMCHQLPGDRAVLAVRGARRRHADSPYRRPLRRYRRLPRSGARAGR